MNGASKILGAALAVALGFAPREAGADVASCEEARQDRIREFHLRFPGLSPQEIREPLFVRVVWAGDDVATARRQDGGTYWKAKVDQLRIEWDPEAKIVPYLRWVDPREATITRIEILPDYVCQPEYVAPDCVGSYDLVGELRSSTVSVDAGDAWDVRLRGIGFGPAPPPLADRSSDLRTVESGNCIPPVGEDLGEWVSVSLVWTPPGETEALPLEARVLRRELRAPGGAKLARSDFEREPPRSSPVQDALRARISAAMRKHPDFAVRVAERERED